ncbi:MAG: hypothetical protein LBK27_00130 [Treponema sp.]|jgi:outer membrane murein-binding lipoprotein Lpp|nr:hypothetical protein [Treponema sp.]
MAKKNYKGLFIMILAAVMVGGLVSCVSVSEVKETETSITLLAAANEILAAEENGMLVDQFQAAFTEKFAGLEFGGQLGSLGSGDVNLDFLYEGLNYRITLVPGEQGYVSARRCVEKVK